MPLIVLLIGLLSAAGAAVLWITVARKPAMQAGVAVREAAESAGQMVAGVANTAQRIGPLAIAGAGVLAVLILLRGR